MKGYCSFFGHRAAKIRSFGPMRIQKVLPATVIIIIGIILLFFNFRDVVNVDNESFTRSPVELQYTRHARCRMDCRQITEAEVRDILANGSINTRKSDPADKPCPTWALEGYTRQDGQHVRIVFAQCSGVTRVVTCIDLDREFNCNCN